MHKRGGLTHQDRGGLRVALLERLGTRGRNFVEMASQVVLTVMPPLNEPVTVSAGGDSLRPF